MVTLPSINCPICSANSLAPECPPNTGMTELPSSATTTTGGSYSFFVITGARSRTRIPSAPMKMIGCLSINNDLN